MPRPTYLKLYESGELDRRIEILNKKLESCTICPRRCRVNRLEDNIGFCRSGKNPIVSSYNAHFGEEPPISGIYGSGTIFFTNCTLRCIYCQNYPISQLSNGKEYSVEELASMMLSLQRRKCHNINFVTPTHFVPQIVSALKIAIKNGFNIPLVYNTSGYESIETLKLLEGIIDIYLPDMKYSDNEMSLKYSGVSDYWEINKLAIKEMFRQVGDLKMDRDGIAYRGLIIRHLVLPYNIAGSKKILEFLKNEVSTTVTIGIMSQYFPAYKAVNDEKLKFKITKEEYDEVVNYAINLGFKNILIQGYY
jgi:putative pyruvate formate lyase activating enzyme